jgi:polysaccharide biosynthesis transport protein
MNTISYPDRRQPQTLIDRRAFGDVSPRLEREQPEEVLSIGHYIWLFRQHSWQIALAVGVVTALATLYCAKVRPVYEATARITIDQRIPSTAIGQEAAAPGSSDVDQLMTTEIQIIQSDAVLRPVAEQFHLMKDGITSGTWNSRATSTSDESVGDAPVALSNLSVVRLPNSLLIDINYRSPDPHLAASVANAIAQSYISRGMETRARSSMGLSTFMERQISELKENMDDSSRALAGYERELGVVNPDEKTSILAARLLQLNTQYTEAENDRIQKETEYREVQSGASSGSGIARYAAALELSPQASMLGRQEEQLHEAEEKLAVLKTVYGPNYAEYKRAANDVAELTSQYQQMRSDISKRIEVSYREAVNREAMLRSALGHAKDESDQLNAHSAQYQELKREAEANKTLYDELFSKIKEAGINAGFESGSIRIADEARPPAYPIFPKKAAFISIAFIFSLMASLLVVLVADMFDKSLRDPDKACRLTGMEVVGLLPNVHDFPATHSALALGNDFYRESIATLLSTVFLSHSTGQPRSILITSASPAEGKSSCAAHLALEHASKGKKTLLIDADLRCPFQQRYFNLKNDVGISWAITHDAPLLAIRQKVEDTPMLDVVVSGLAAQHMFKRVGLKVSELLQQAALEKYDLVIVDAPPMLGLTEPIEIACLTDGVLVIGDASRTNQQDVTDILAILERVHANLFGLVLNRFRPEVSESYKRYRSYSAYARRLSAKAS